MSKKLVMILLAVVSIACLFVRQRNAKLSLEGDATKIWTVYKTYAIRPGGADTPVVAQDVFAEDDLGRQTGLMFRFSHKQFQQVLGLREGHRIRIQHAIEVMDEADPLLRYTKISILSN